MSHEEFSKLIGPYLDGELSAAEREKVENCLADSAECRQLASELEELDRVARGDSPPVGAKSRSLTREEANIPGYRSLRSSNERPSNTP